MNESKINDKRGQDRPREVFASYPKCATCRYFEVFVDAQGMPQPGNTICVINPPVVTAQIQGVDEDRHIVWASRTEWPLVAATQRCGRHSAKDAN